MEKTLIKIINKKRKQAVYHYCMTGEPQVNGSVATLNLVYETPTGDFSFEREVNLKDWFIMALNGQNNKYRRVL